MATDERPEVATKAPARPTPYFTPPERYGPPEFCGLCGSRIIFTRVVGGVRWVHLTSYAEHEVQMSFRWWDTLTGTWQSGTWSPYGREASDLAGEPPEQREGEG